MARSREEAKRREVPVGNAALSALRIAGSDPAIPAIFMFLEILYALIIMNAYG